MSKIMVEQNLYGVFYKDGDKWKGPYHGSLFYQKDLKEAMQESREMLKKKVCAFKMAWVKETKPRNPFTKRYKDIAGCQSPKATDCEGNRYYTNYQIKRAKELARGQFWDQKEFCEFVAYSSKGKRKIFVYDYTLKEIPVYFAPDEREGRLKASLMYHDAKKKAKAWSEKS